MKEKNKDIIVFKDNTKDGWDKFKILSSLLVPITIALVGILLSQSQKKSERLISEINARVRQAELVASFLNDLTSNDQKKQKLAIESILIALPDEGPKLVSIVSKTEPDSNIKEFAENSLINLCKQLVRDLFHEDKNIRNTALAQLRSDYWKFNSNLVPILLEIANQNLNHPQGRINTLKVLQNASIDIIKKNKNEVLEYLEFIEKNKDKWEEANRNAQIIKKRTKM